MSISIKNKTRKSPPRLPFERMAESVLGKSYDLSLVFCGEAESHKLNYQYRGKDKPTNVLSFPISPNSGEIFIDLKTAEKEYKNFGLSFQKFVGYLFIHGLLHLKGMEHGYTMEKAEKTLLKKFLNTQVGSSHNNRH
ncbi:rRNA maturation RNase YbeY [Candidatus Parcubacteria bacterium]|nr:rRNA maturation RNase YbeY [Candidatus Parcubacteria bacterium]